VTVGQLVRMKNVAANEELSCTVIDVNRGSMLISEVGLEFTQPNPNFWRVSFPPADWSPRNPEAKRYAGENLVADDTSAKK
jgi:hypothetical protein